MIWPDPPLYSCELIQQCVASDGSFFISKCALAWSGVPACVWRGEGEGVCVWAGAQHIRQTHMGSEREGQQARMHCGPSLVVFSGPTLTTQGWVFPHCSAEQSGHLILTDTNTGTHRRKHTETHTRTCRHTLHAPCSCCQWCQSWFGQSSLLFHEHRTEEASFGRAAQFFCL